MTVPSTQSEIQTTQYSGHFTNHGVVSVIGPRGSLGAQCGVQTGIAVGNDLGGSDQRREATTDSKTRDASLRVQEAKTFLKVALPTMYGTLFAVAVITGMRPSEYIGLKWQDLDRERGTVSVKRTLRKGLRVSGNMVRRSAQEVGESSGCKIGSLLA
jgi:hypothetical protein